ncbi:unnamed protein product [Prorocentrum cordatum]|uniref:Uncharacterized protein n=1 Tax=Prorocentrum cordatum TaxID=2364126 RepID=A0ABN9RKY6_9DINO|nr:unnamed protein product [Polarella glacialis]
MDSADAASPKTISRGLRRLLPAFAADALSPKDSGGGASAPSPAHSPKWASQRCRWPEAASASGQLPRPPPPVARGPPRASQRAAPGHRLVSLCRAVGVVRAGAPIQGAGPTLGVPTVSGSTVGGVAGGRRGRTSALAEALAAAQTPLRKRVCFSHEIPDTLDVTPYSSHYGIHPNFFDFDRDGDMRLTFTGIAEVFRRKEAGLAPLEEDMQEFLNPACAAEF